MRWAWGCSLVATAAISGIAIAAPPRTPAPLSTLDYADPRNWVCSPDKPCDDDLTAAVLTANGEGLERFKPASAPKIDCFYVYPTVSMSREQNAPPGVTEAERRAVRQQVARLASVCRIYSPFYRQFTAGAMLADPPPDAARREAGFRLAEADVFAAWDHYLAHDNGGRGVVLIGHSQGANVLQGLIHRYIEG